jgi:hypothetical protein
VIVRYSLRNSEGSEGLEGLEFSFQLVLHSLNPLRLYYYSCIFYSVYCWKDSYNPVIVAGHVDKSEGLLFWSAPLRGFGPDSRTVTLVNTSTVTIILCYCIILVISIRIVVILLFRRQA